MLPLLLLQLAQAAHPLAPLVAAGDCAQVLTKLVDVSSEAELFLKGYCHLKMGQNNEAIAPLRAIHQPVLIDYAQLSLAEAYAARHDWEAVLSAVKTLDLPGDAGRRARLLTAEAYLNLGQYTLGRETMLPLLDGDLGVQARFTLAAAAIKLPERRAAAIKTYQRTWVEAGNSVWATAAQEALAQKGITVPSFATPADKDRVWDRYQNLRKANLHGEALALLLQLRTHAPDYVKPTELAHAYFRAKDYISCVKTWSAVLGPPPKASGDAFSLFEYALAMSRTGDYERAAQIYTRLAAQHPQHKRADTATYKLAYLRYDRAEYRAAIGLFSRYLERYPKGRHADEARWFIARCHWSVDEQPEAISAFKRLVAKHPRSSLAPGAAYWTARSLNAAQQDQALEQLLKRWPLSAYAYFAAVRLNRTFKPQPIASAQPWPEAWRNKGQIARATLLLDLGLRGWARDAMSGLEAQLKNEPKALRLTGAAFLLEAGDARAAKRLAKPFCVSPWKTGDPVAQQLCTPRLAQKLVEKTARYYGIDPLIPYGIMTAESALKPSVTSIAGARGLMQLMPKEARSLHQSLFPSRPYDADDLFTVSYNATLGTAELGTKARLLGDVLTGIDSPAMIAAYNGGEEAVKRWTHGDTPEFDEFSENIGYSETRRYVKRVLGYTMAYRWVYGDPIDGADLTPY